MEVKGMYYEDLSLYSYRVNTNETSYNIGWLGRDYSNGKYPAYSKGEVSEQFVDKLWKYLKYPVNIYRGMHYCELCTNNANILKYKGEERKVGYYEMRVFSKTGKVYAAPSMILHYIKEHNYKPPKEFIDAVMEGDASSKEYIDKLLEYKKDYYINLRLGEQGILQ